MTRKKVLSHAQAALIVAMRKGVTVRFMSGLDAYYYRDDTGRKCTQQVIALFDLKLVKVGMKSLNGNYSVELIDTPESREFLKEYRL